MEGTGSRSPDRLVAGRYRLTRMLGRGGMGTVWRATDELMRREVAVKELRAPEGLAATERAKFEERALREARTAGRINHPGVVGIHDLIPATADDPAAYIVMELVEAPSLADVLEREGALPEQRVVTIAAGILDALKAAHAINLIHRDVKPSNIMVLGRDKVKLVDFGIAHAADDTRLTRHGVAGSLGYIAPELFDGKQPSAASDLWAVGVTLYQAASGLRLFERTSTAATIRAILQDDVPPLERHPRLARVVTGLLTRDPERRMTGYEASAALRADEQASAAAATGADSAGAAREGDFARTTRNEHAGGRATWEEEPTNVRTDPPRSRSSRERSTKTGTSTNDEAQPLQVEPPQKVRAVDGMLLFALAVLLAFAGWRLLYKTWGWPVWGLLLAALFALLVLPSAVRAAWWGAVSVDDDGIHLHAADKLLSLLSAPPGNTCFVSWEHIDQIVLVRRPLLDFLDLEKAKTDIYLRMGAATPRQVRRQAPFMGADRAGDDETFTWFMGESDLPLSEIRDVLRAAAPARVTIMSRGPDNSDVKQLRHHGPRRPAVGWCTVGLVAVILATYVFHHSDGPIRLADSGWSSHVVFSGQGGLLASDTDDHDVVLWNCASHERTATLSGLTGTITDLRFNNDGTLLAASDDNSTIKVWNTSSQALLSTLPVGHGISATRLAFSPDEETLASVNTDHTIVVWNTTTGRTMRTINEPQGAVFPVAFSTDGQTLSGLDGTGTIHRWSIATGRPVSAAEPGDSLWAHISGSDPNSVEILDDSGDFQRTLTGHTDEITDFDWAGAGLDLIATSSKDHTIRIWHANTGKTVKKLTLNYHDGIWANAINFSPDGKFVAYGSSDQLWLWKTGISS